jgi:hypothetical protein
MPELIPLDPFSVARIRNLALDLFAGDAPVSIDFDQDMPVMHIHKPYAPEALYAVVGALIAVDNAIRGNADVDMATFDQDIERFLPEAGRIIAEAQRQARTPGAPGGFIADFAQEVNDAADNHHARQNRME